MSFQYPKHGARGNPQYVSHLLGRITSLVEINDVPLIQNSRGFGTCQKRRLATSSGRGDGVQAHMLTTGEYLQAAVSHSNNTTRVRELFQPIPYLLNRALIHSYEWSYYVSWRRHGLLKA